MITIEGLEFTRPKALHPGKVGIYEEGRPVGLVGLIVTDEDDALKRYLIPAKTAREIAAKLLEQADLVDGFNAPRH